MTVSSAKVKLAVNGYPKMSAAGKQEGCAKTQDGLLPCTSWDKDKYSFK